MVSPVWQWLRRKSPVSLKTCRRLHLEDLEGRLAPATFVWSGLGTNTNLSNLNNWAGRVAPNPAGGDDLVFGPGPTQKLATNDFINASFNSISFTDSGYTLNAIPSGMITPVTLSNGITDSSAGGGNRVNLPQILLAKDQSFVAANPGTVLNFASVITLADPTGFTAYTLTLGGAGTIDFQSGALDDTRNPGSIVKVGTGRAIIETENHYLGSTTVSAGILAVRAPQFGLGEPDKGITPSPTFTRTGPLPFPDGTLAADYMVSGSFFSALPGLGFDGSPVTVADGATLQLGDIAHTVNLGEKSIYLGGAGYNGLGALDISVGTVTIGNPTLTSATANSAWDKYPMFVDLTPRPRTAGGNIFLSSDTTNVINVATGATVTHYMGIKGGWKKGDDIFQTPRSLTKIGGGTLVEDGNFWHTDVWDPAMLKPSPNTFYPEMYLASAANTYTGPTMVNDGTLILQKHIVDEKGTVHHYNVPASFTFKDPDQQMLMIPPMYFENMSIQGPLVVGDDVGAPHTARVIIDKDFQVTYTTNYLFSFADVNINSDGQMIPYISETFDQINILHGNLEIPHGISVTVGTPLFSGTPLDALTMTGGSITSTIDPPSGPSPIPGVVVVRTPLRQNPDPTTATIQSDLLFSTQPYTPQSVTVYVSRGTSPLDLDIQGHILGIEGNLILSGSGIVRLGGDNSALTSGTIQMAGSVTLNLGNDKALGKTELEAGAGTLTSDAARILPNTLRITGSLGVAGMNPITFTNKAYLIGNPGEKRTLTIGQGAVLHLTGGLSETPGTGIGLVKNGPGTLHLLMTSDFSGGTEVLAGTLLVDGTLLIDKPVLVDGGTLSGTGSVGPVTANGGGSVAAGSGGMGSLTAAGVTLGPGSTLTASILGTTPGTKYPQLISNGVFAITSPDDSPTRFPVLALTFPSNFNSNIGDTFLLVVNNTLNPIPFTGLARFQAPNGKVLPEGATFTPAGAAAGQLYQITYQAGPNKNSVAITRVNAPPTAPQLTVTPTAILVGKQVTLTGTFTDPDTKDTHTVLINWGDGTTTNLSLVAGMFTFGPVTHTYSGAASLVPPGQASLVIMATVTDNHGASATGQTTVTVIGIGSSVGEFDPTTGTWYLRTSASAGPADAGAFVYGLATWTPVTGDWNGDRVTTVGVVDPVTATWYLRNENSSGGPDAGAFKYGMRGWIPVSGDWGGSGTTGIGMFDPKTATWYLRNKPNAGGTDAGTFQFGAPGWIPVTGDWDGTGKTGIGVVDPKTLTWYLKSTLGAGAPTISPFQFGGVGYKVVAGNWNGDGRTQAGVVSPAGVWYLRTGTVNSPTDLTSFPYGLGNWIPVSGVWQLPPVPMRAQGHQASATRTSLTQADLDASVGSILARLQEEGIDAARLGQLASMQFHVGQLTGGVLGVASARDNGVVIDASAAGFGWYTGSASLDNVFNGGQGDSWTAVPGGPADGRMDLQTAVLVEMGRLGALENQNRAGEDALLATSLEPGVRLTEDLALIQGGKR